LRKFSISEEDTLKIMSVDLGDVRTGIASCDKDELIASPVGVIHEKDHSAILQKVSAIAREQKAAEVVVGYPKNMDNTVGAQAEKCSGFAKLLTEELEGDGIKVRLWDERGTTALAHGLLDDAGRFGKKRKQVVDAVAAVVILENYMAYRRNNGLYSK